MGYLYVRLWILCVLFSAPIEFEFSFFSSEFSFFSSEFSLDNSLNSPEVMKIEHRFKLFKNRRTVHNLLNLEIAIYKIYIKIYKNLYNKNFEPLQNTLKNFEQDEIVSECDSINI